MPGEERCERGSWALAARREPRLRKQCARGGKRNGVDDGGPTLAAAKRPVNAINRIDSHSELRTHRTIRASHAMTRCEHIRAGQAQILRRYYRALGMVDAVVSGIAVETGSR